MKPKEPTVDTQDSLCTAGLQQAASSNSIFGVLASPSDWFSKCYTGCIWDFIHQPAEILHLMFLYHRTSVNLRTTQNLSTDHKLTDSPKILHPKHFSFRILGWILLSCTFIHQQSSSNWKGEEALYTRVCWKWRNCIVHTWGRTYHTPA